MMSKITCVVNDIVLDDMELKSEHGLSFWIETEAGIVLFDTGQTSTVLAHNLDVLGLEVNRIDTVVLSHAHIDHTGGLGWLLTEKPMLPLYAHADIFRPRFSRKNGQYQSKGMPLDKEFITRHAALRLSERAEEILPGLWTSGEIHERIELEGRSAQHFIKSGNDYVADPYKDDLSLVYDSPDGLILICGCCHAGLLNTLAQVERDFEKPLRAVIGGTHMLPYDGPSLRHIISVLDEEYPEIQYYLNHCTGEHAIKELRAVFGERVHACPGGITIDLDLVCK